jgi:fluoroacetyl-CoA thioesterase
MTRRRLPACALQRSWRELASVSMTLNLEPGAYAERVVTVDEQRCVSFLGPDSMVYATPRMLSDMEGTCRDLLLKHLEPGQDSVGTHATLDHLAATPLGMEVRIEAKVIAIERRSVTFTVVARDSLEECGRATHVRVVVDNKKRSQRLAHKRAQLNMLDRKTAQ